MFFEGFKRLKIILQIKEKNGVRSSTLGPGDPPKWRSETIAKIDYDDHRFEKISKLIETEISKPHVRTGCMQELRDIFVSGKWPNIDDYPRIAREIMDEYNFLGGALK